MSIGPNRIVQSIFGLVLITFSLMPVFGWEPPPVSSAAQPMQQAILSAGYIIPLILVVYFLVGLSWLLGQFVALSAVVLFPITLNIVLFHSLLNRAPFGLVAAFLLLSINLYMLFERRASYRQVLDRNG